MPTDVQAAAQRLLNEREIHIHEYDDNPEGPGLTADILTVARFALDAAARIERLETQAAGNHNRLRKIYLYAAEIRQMTAFARIGFRCSLILEAVSRSLSDEDARRLHDEVAIILEEFDAEPSALTADREADESRH